MIRLGQSGPVTGRLAKVFAVNRAGLNVARGLEAVAVLAVPFVLLTVLDVEKYLLSVLFGVLFVALSDPGGALAQRLRPMVGVAVGGTVPPGSASQSGKARGDSSCWPRSSSPWPAG